MLAQRFDDGLLKLLDLNNQDICFSANGQAGTIRSYTPAHADLDLAVGALLQRVDARSPKLLYLVISVVVT
ncbi:hypothetical protein ASG40_01525 [Methylobacterium sp. Leaf399]|nr:hypothetical protein ASG40_01525 [Methylobacterium sp. Leaf399]